MVGRTSLSKWCVRSVALPVVIYTYEAGVAQEREAEVISSCKDHSIDTSILHTITEGHAAVCT